MREQNNSCDFSIKTDGSDIRINDNDNHSRSSDDISIEELYVRHIEVGNANSIIVEISGDIRTIEMNNYNENFDCSILGMSTGEFEIFVNESFQNQLSQSFG